MALPLVLASCSALINPNTDALTSRDTVDDGSDIDISTDFESDLTDPPDDPDALDPHPDVPDAADPIVDPTVEEAIEDPTETTDPPDDDGIATDPDVDPVVDSFDPPVEDVMAEPYDPPVEDMAPEVSDTVTEEIITDSYDPPIEEVMPDPVSDPVEDDPYSDLRDPDDDEDMMDTYDPPYEPISDSYDVAAEDLDWDTGDPVGDTYDPPYDTGSGDMSTDPGGESSGLLADSCEGTTMTTTGKGLSKSWFATGNLLMAHDDYSSTCGGAGGPDNVHHFDIPTEYETYGYRVMVSGPAPLDPVTYVYGGATTAKPCGAPSAYLGCNDDGESTCWASRSGAVVHDADDSCWHGSSNASGVSFPDGRSYVVVDTKSGGGTYSVQVDRTQELDISDCNLPLPEVQMGGTWTGRTSDATTTWPIGIPNCVSSTHADCSYLNMYQINHVDAPWSSLDRGYIITTDGTTTPGGFNNVLFLSMNRCDAAWYLLSCDDDSQHNIMGGSGHGSRIVTGRIPAGRWAGAIVGGYGCYESGNYTMTVEIDSDGDGVPDSVDGSGKMYGSRSTDKGGDRAKLIPHWPWGDHGNSFDYPRNDLGPGGREVYYYFDNTMPGRTMNAKVIPRIRGDVWSGAPLEHWDATIWFMVPVSQNVYCDGSGWTWVTAGTWTSCDQYGPGEWELIDFGITGAGRYWIAIDSSSTTPRGGWYSLELD